MIEAGPGSRNGENGNAAKNENAAIPALRGSPLPLQAPNETRTIIALPPGLPKAFMVSSLSKLAFAFALIGCGLEPLAFASEPGSAHRPHVHFLIGEDEYSTKTTLPQFAASELEPAGIQCTSSIAPDESPNDFPGMEALRDADLLFISARRRAPGLEVMQLIRNHLAAGKPLAGIRTASHAFSPPLGSADKAPPEGHTFWREFDHEILGGNYHDHYPPGLPSLITLNPKSAGHPVLQGVTEFQAPSHLYKNPDLPSKDTILLYGRVEGGAAEEPVAWIIEGSGSRIFYTSLGGQKDFDVPQFRRLLRNGIFWSLQISPTDSGNKPGTSARPQ